MSEPISPKTVLILESPSSNAVPLSIWPAGYEIITSSGVEQAGKIIDTEQVDLLAVSCSKTEQEMSQLLTKLSKAVGNKHIPLLVVCNLEQPISMLPGTQEWPAKVGLAHSLTDKRTISLTIQNLSSESKAEIR